MKWDNNYRKPGSPKYTDPATTNITFVADSVATGRHFGSLSISGFNEFKDFVHLSGVDLGSLLGAAEGIAHSPLLRPFSASLHEFVVNRRLDEDTSAGATALACGFNGSIVIN